jgi:hypothetical protein
MWRRRVGNIGTQEIKYSRTEEEGFWTRINADLRYYLLLVTVRGDATYIKEKKIKKKKNGVGWGDLYPGFTPPGY